MSDMIFDIVFKGRFSRDVGREKAILHFAKIFKQSPQKAELFFDGKARVLKKSLPMEKANHIRAMLKKAGLRVSLEKIKPQSESPQEDAVTIDKVGTVIVNKPYVEPLHIDTSAMDLDEVGVQIVKKQTVATPEFDLDDIELDEVGAQMAKKQPVDVPEFDLSHLQASDVTSALEQKAEVETVDYQIDEITMEDVGAQIAEKKHIPPPQFDLDSIQLKD